MINYDVAVHSANWPTMQALQECIDAYRWPVKIGEKANPQWTKPLTKSPYALGLPVVFKGAPIELEASLSTLTLNDPLDINDKLAGIGASDVRFGEGDRVLTITFRANIKEYQAGFYVMAALIKCFNGYGFHGRNHGGQGYADSLIAEAARLESEGQTPIDGVQAKRTLDDFLNLHKKLK